MLRDFWRDFIGAVDGIKDVRVREVLDVLDEIVPGKAPVPAEQGRRRLSPVPNLQGTGQVGAEARQVQRLHRVLELSGVQIHPSVGHQPQQASANKVLGKDPETGLDTSRSRRTASAPTSSSARPGEKVKEEKPKRAGIPKGTNLDDIDARKARSCCSACRARSARTRRTGKPILRQEYRPFWPLGDSEAKTYAEPRIPARTC